MLFTIPREAAREAARKATRDEMMPRKKYRTEIEKLNQQYAQWKK